MSVTYEHRQEQGRIQVNERPTLDRKPAMELRGCWLLLARTVWLSISVLILGLFVAGIPFRYHEFATLSIQAGNALQHLSPGWGRSLLQLALAVNVYPVWALILEIALMLGFTLIAILVYRRKSDDWRSMSGFIVFTTYGTYVTGSLDALTRAYPLWRFPVSCLHTLGIALTLIFLYILPDARFVPRWTRPLACIWVVWTAAWLVFPGMPYNFSHPYTLPFSWFLVFMIWLGTGILAQYYRYRHLSNRRRQLQTRWVLLSLIAGFISYAVFYVPRFVFPALSQPGIPHVAYTLLGEPLFLLSMLLIPLVILFSMLRYRLFGVDVIIKRTLVYGTLTAVLVLVYFGSVMLLQHLFNALTGQGSPLVVAGSTLVIALLFQPLRNRIQTAIDRRFYHSRYDAVQTLAAFEDRLRMYDELDLITLKNDVLEVIQATIQPAHVSLMLVEPVHQEEERDNRGWLNTQTEQRLEERSLQNGLARDGNRVDMAFANKVQESPLPCVENRGQPSEIQVTAFSRESASRMSLAGYKLLIARVVWVILAVCTLGLFLAALPFHFAHLYVVCADIMCGGSQSTAELENQLGSMGLTIHVYATYSLTLQLVFALVYFTIATVIFWRKSNDLMALLVALFLMTFVLAFTDVPKILARAYPTWAWPITLIGFIGQISFPLCFYLFPNGRFTPRWARWLLAVWIIWEGWTYILVDASINSSENFLMFESVAFTLGLGSIVITQIYRYRHVSSKVQRQQTKWVVFGMTAGLGGFFGSGVFGFVVPHMLFPILFIHPSIRLIALMGITAYTSTYLSMLLIPLSIGIAMSRYRLWELDVLINRTLIYGTLIGILGLIFLGSLIAQQQFLFAVIGRASELFIVGSTLGIVALFQPLRRGIKGVINRSFYRHRYKAEQALAAFGTTLRDEVDLSKLTEQLVTVVHETMEPTTVSLWLSERALRTTSSRYTGLLRI